MSEPNFDPTTSTPPYPPSLFPDSLAELDWGDSPHDRLLNRLAELSMTSAAGAFHCRSLDGSGWMRIFSRSLASDVMSAVRITINREVTAPQGDREIHVNDYVVDMDTGAGLVAPCHIGLRPPSETDNGGRTWDVLSDSGPLILSPDSAGFRIFSGRDYEEKILPQLLLRRDPMILLDLLDDLSTLTKSAIEDTNDFTLTLYPPKP